jgi:hypothetical protein
VSLPWLCQLHSDLCRSYGACLSVLPVSNMRKLASLFPQRIHSHLQPVSLLRPRLCTTPHFLRLSCLQFPKSSKVRRGCLLSFVDPWHPRLLGLGPDLFVPFPLARHLHVLPLRYHGLHNFSLLLNYEALSRHPSSFLFPFRSLLLLPAVLLLLAPLLPQHPLPDLLQPRLLHLAHYLLPPPQLLPMFRCAHHYLALLYHARPR